MNRSGRWKLMTPKPTANDDSETNGESLMAMQIGLLFGEENVVHKHNNGMHIDGIIARIRLE
ncbi:MAG: hypothetical protein ACKVH7_12335 [Alphaproteobacteria bacterium]|jgi:FtsZ-interacting cell division protein ZipA